MLPQKRKTKKLSRTLSLSAQERLAVIVIQQALAAMP